MRGLAASGKRPSVGTLINLRSAKGGFEAGPHCRRPDHGHGAPERFDGQLDRDLLRITFADMRFATAGRQLPPTPCSSTAAH